MLPSLLAKNNVPAMAKAVRTRLRIHTTLTFKDKIEGNILFQRMAKVADTKVTIDPGIDLSNPTLSHHRVWTNARKNAKSIDAYVLFIAPDSVWSNGSLNHFANILKKRPGAIFFPGFRATQETFCTDIKKIFPDTDIPIELSSRDLMRIAARNMSPLMTVFLHDSPSFPKHAENILWPVADEGFIVRQPIAHSFFAIGPEGIDINEYSLPASDRDLEKIHWVTDSDNIMFVSFSPLCAYTEWYTSRGPMSSVSVAQYSLSIDNPIVDVLSRRAFRFHSEPCTEALWRQEQRKSDIFIERFMVARSLLRIWRVLREQKLIHASKWLALALAGRELDRIATNVDALTVFVPTDEAVDMLPTLLRDTLALPSGKKDLFQALSAHVYQGKLKASDLTVIARQTGQIYDLKITKKFGRLFVNGAMIIVSDIVTGQHTLHIIDRVLAPVPKG